MNRYTCSETMHMCKLDVKYQGTHVKTYTCMDEQRSPPMSKPLHMHKQVKMLVCVVRSPVMLVRKEREQTRTLTKIMCVQEEREKEGSTLTTGSTACLYERCHAEMRKVSGKVYDAVGTPCMHRCLHAQMQCTQSKSLKATMGMQMGSWTSQHRSATLRNLSWGPHQPQPCFPLMSILHPGQHPLAAGLHMGLVPYCTPATQAGMLADAGMA
jgi:hypothetical protein